MNSAKLQLVLRSLPLMLLSNRAYALGFNFEGMEPIIFAVTFVICTALGIVPTALLHKKFPRKVVWLLAPVFGYFILMAIVLMISLL